MRKGMMPLLLGAAALTLVGCAARLCPEDRLLLKQAIDASRSAAACARQGEQAAVPNEAAASVTPAGPARTEVETEVESALQRAEMAAERAQLAAERAELAAEMARKSFESGLRK